MKTMQNKRSGNAQLIKSTPEISFLLYRLLLLWILVVGLSLQVTAETTPPQAAPWVQFTIYPEEAVKAGAQWRLATETEWRNSGLNYTNIQPGTYPVEFKELPGWIAPSILRPVVIKPESNISLSATYYPIEFRPDTGNLVMFHISPPQAVEAGAAWKLATETEWRDPRQYYADMPVGESIVEFKPVPGWKAPPSYPYTFEGGYHFSSHRYDPEQSPAQLGSFIVYASPGPAGAQWKFTSETEWRNISVYYTNLAPGAYVIEFKPVEGWIAPTNRSVVLQERSAASISARYEPRPQYLVDLNAINGQIVGDIWHPLSLISMKVEDFNNMLWFQASLPFNQGIAWVPHNNAGRIAALLARARSGYQFTGWSGDAQGMRNPVSILLDSDKEVTAQFAPVSTTNVTATQLAEFYYSPGVLTVHAQVNCPINQKFETMSWRPFLPQGWTLLSAQGFGMPKVEQGKVLFTQPLASYNPVQFNLIIKVPENQTGSQILQGEIEYTLKEGTNTISGSAQANSLQIVRQEIPAPQMSLDLSSGPALLTLQGNTGKTYLLYRQDQSAGDIAWRRLTAFTLTNSVQTWLDPQAGTNAGATFYRAALLE